MHRVQRYIYLSCFSFITIYLVYISLDSSNIKYLLSMGTAYTGLILLAATLVIGPLNVIFKKANPVSSYVRRDIAICAGIVALVHMVIGLEVHLGGKYWNYFLQQTDTGFRIRFDAFGLANYLGIIVAVLIIVLLYLSNNNSIKKYGIKKWKKLQQYNYVIFLFVIGHGVLYQLLEKRYLPYILIIAFIFFVVLSLQWQGYKLYRKRL